VSVIVEEFRQPFEPGLGQVQKVIYRSMSQNSSALMGQNSEFMDKANRLHRHFVAGRGERRPRLGDLLELTSSTKGRNVESRASAVFYPRRTNDPGRHRMWPGARPMTLRA
jgi:hypothetical protein